MERTELLRRGLLIETGTVTAFAEAASTRRTARTGQRPRSCISGAETFGRRAQDQEGDGAADSFFAHPSGAIDLDQRHSPSTT